jgi:conjugative relaxase-like TrwC/TraI family protein
MLSIGKLAAGPGAGRYYVDHVAQGREDYYAAEGEDPGVWLGTGAEALGLSGQVSEHGIVRLLSSCDPATGAALRRPLARGAMAGFDLTFRAPKSVSILFGIGEPDVVREIVRAHEEAVAQAIGYLEREACQGRRGHGGAASVPGRGFVAAAFRHRTSRAGDPLLHTHVVVANTTQGPDGRWTALDGRPLYRHAKTAGYLYQAVLRDELRQCLKVRWGAVERGTAEIDGVPRGVIEHFSRRRAEIVEHMAARGERSARAAQVATLETRRSKDYGVPVARLRAEWRARAAEHGLDHSRLRRVLRVVADRRYPEELAEVVAVRLEGADGLTRERSTFTRRELLQALSDAARPGAPVATLERQTNAFLERPEIVELEAGRGDQRFTTRTLMRLERELLESADQRQTEPAGIADRGAVGEALRSRPTLSGEQRTLVLALAREGGGVQVIRAAAGTGKTYALGAAVEAWQRSGIPVIGCALSARAACELRDQTGVDATTIAWLRVGLARGVTLALGSVLLVDEAGTVGTRDLAALSDSAAHAQAKIVLIGDDRQLPEIQAGGAFRALAERCGAIELREVRRQHEGWDRDALAALRAGGGRSLRQRVCGARPARRGADRRHGTHRARRRLVGGVRGRRERDDDRSPPTRRRRAQRPRPRADARRRSPRPRRAEHRWSLVRGGRPRGRDPQRPPPRHRQRPAWCGDVR